MKIRAVAIDYIGRCDLSDNQDDKKEWQLLLSAARKLKTVAQQMGIVVFMLSQVDGQGKLAMAKYMQHEADLHLHVRPMTDEEKTECLKTLDTHWNYAVVIEKGRSCPKGFIPVRFVGEKLIFITDEEAAKKHAKQECGGDSQVNQNQGNYTKARYQQRDKRRYSAGDDNDN